MCHYCGCRQVPLIRDYIAEHEHVLDLGHRALEQGGRGELDAAHATLAQMHAELRSHWRGEEEGVFALMRGEELYRSYIDPLVAEHRVLDELLGTLDMRDPAHHIVLRDQVEELHVHVSREEDGIFPVTLVEFSGPEWDAAIDAWERAHPGQQLIED